jgi:RNA polymerase sigma factor (sigma-70 family)
MAGLRFGRDRRHEVFEGAPLSTESVQPVAEWAREPARLRDPRNPSWADCRAFVRRILAGPRFRIAGEDLEDVTQTTCLNLWRKLSEFTPDRVEAYVASLAEQRAGDYFRQRKRRAARFAAYDPSVHDRPDRGAIGGERLLALVAEGIPAIAQTFFERHDPNCLHAMRAFFLDESYRDLAMERDMEVNTVVKRWSRCRAALEDHLRRRGLLELLGGGGSHVAG